MSGPGGTVLRTGLLIVLALALQAAVVSPYHVMAATGDIMLLVSIAAGIAGGAERGAVVGFFAGMCFDLVLQTPFGLSALTYSLVGYAVGMLQGSVLRSSWWIPVLSALVASAVGIVVFVLAGQVLGQHFRLPDLPQIILVVSVLNALLVIPAVRALRWALGPGPERVGIVLR